MRLTSDQKSTASATVHVVATSRSGLGRWAVSLLLGLSTVVGGCGREDSAASPALLSGMPKCDASLLHPRITVGAVAGAPNLLIVYVDGVMACVDDTARVDQIVSQIDTGSSIHAAGAPTSVVTTSGPTTTARSER